MSLSNMHLLKLNISNEPKTTDGGIIICNYGELLLEIYIDNNQTDPFYLKVGQEIIESIDNKIKLEHGLNINNVFPIVYNKKYNSNLIAVFYTKEPVIIDQFIAYN